MSQRCGLEKDISIESELEPPRAVANGHTIDEDDSEVPEQGYRSQLASPLSWRCLCN